MKLRLNWTYSAAALLVAACASPTDEQLEPTTKAASALTLAAGSPAARSPAGSSQPDAAGATKQAAAGPGTRVSHRSRKDPDAMHRPTGRREMTPQELEAYQKTTPRVVGVRPTQLRVDRLRDSGATTHADPTAKSSEAAGSSGTTSQVVPFGSDIVTAAPGEASTPEATTAAVTELPRSVDNSTLSAFPEIRNQGDLNSCVAFAVGYYQYTYTLGKLLGWNNKNATNTTKVSPKWLYNLGNSGGDYGSSPPMIHDILRRHGALTWAEFPYVGTPSDPANYLAWPTTSTLWKSALKFQSLGYANVGGPTEPGVFSQVKSLLANGQVLTFSTNIRSWEYEQVDNDPSTADDDSFFGQRIATWQNGWDGAHEATIVGYNDDIWVDLNANGVVESGEKGAFKIANSWGADWWNSGYGWVAYDALWASSAVPNGPSSDSRNPLIGWITALLGANTNSQPKLLAEFTVSTASRGELNLSLRQTELDRTDAVDDYRPIMFLNAGNYAFDGTQGTQAKTASFVFDLSDVALSYGDLKYLLRAENLGSVPSTISNFSITDRLRNNLKTTSTDPSATIAPNQVKSQSIRYKFQDPTRVPQIAIAPSASIAFGTIALGQSVQRQITVQNTGTGDLAVSSLRFDNPLFLMKRAEPLRLIPGESRAIDLEFAPAATQSETATLSLRNTSTNLPTPTFALSGAATSTNASAPYQVFITQQNSPTDNSVALRAELKSRVSTSTALSNYQVVYYLDDPGLDPTSVVWETFYSNVGTINASVKRVYLGKELGPRKADMAVTFRFPAGATLAPGASAIFQGTLHRLDYGWYPNENDDWSRFLRRDGMAEGTIVQQISNQNVLFGLPGEGRAGAYQLNVSPNPATTQTTVTFTVNNPSETQKYWGLYIFTGGGDSQDFRKVWVPSVGTQTVDLDTSWYPPGTYAAVIQLAMDRLDAYTFTKR